MFAVVLVGGFGTRLRPLTNDIPKPMLPVLHRPMIVWLVEQLAEAGVADVVLALGFKPEPFQAAFPDGGYGGVRVHYAVEPEPLDTAGAIAFAARAIGVDDTFVVANGDIITDLPIAELVAAHREFGAEATIHLTAVADPSAFGVVEIEPSGLVRRFLEKPSPGETLSNLINAGTYVLEPSVLDDIEPRARVSVERTVFPRLVDRGSLYGYPTDHYWLDAGKPDEFLRANLDVLRGVRGNPVNGVHRAAIVDPGSIIVESVVGPNAQIAAGARVIESVLLADARVDEGALVERSIIAGTVAAGATVADSVIGRGYTVRFGTHVAGVRLPAPE
jgi:mannose-1-phosphate guanylyltransferase